MKKPLALAIGAAVVALAYPASAWLLGTRVEAALDERYRSFDEQPYIKLVSRDFQRGIFSSTETATIELLGLAEQIATKKAEDALPEAAATVPATPIRITLRTEIKHGPLPGFSTLAAAVADSELILSTEQQQQVAALLGDKKPLQVHTVFSLFGGGVSTASSPAATFDLPKNAEGKSSHVNWGGLQMNIDFSSHMKHYTLKADAPGLEIKDDSGAQAQLAGLHIQADQERIFDDVPGFYSGSAKMTLDQLSVVNGKEADSETAKIPPVILKQISYDAAVPLNGEYIDLIGKVGVETAQFEAQNYGPAHYDFSLRHLHARSTATLYRATMKWYADTARLAARDTGSTLKAMEPLREPALALLKYSPEVHIDRISFKSPQGEAQISASAKLGALQPEELANPFMLIGKLDASADLALPEEMLGDSFKAAQIATFVEQGYALREGNMLHSKIAFRNGQVTVNGKAFNPMQMGRGE